MLLVEAIAQISKSSSFLLLTLLLVEAKAARSSVALPSFHAVAVGAVGAVAAVAAVAAAVAVPHLPRVR